MIVFEALWVFLLLPLPLLIAWTSGAYKTQRDALRVPFFQRLVSLSDSRPGDGALILQRNTVQKIAIALTWLLLIAALADPQWIGDPVVKQLPARDLMMAVDISGSMEAEDFVFEEQAPVTRLVGVKTILEDFARRREHDRLGLIVFGSTPYLQIPFSLDHNLFATLLAQVQPRMAGPKTMLGDAIGLAIKHFSTSTSQKKVLILLTDGNDSGSLVPPVEAARVALDEGIVIHTIAVGDPEASGEQELDLDTLKLVSAVTGGVSFRAVGGDQLQKIYQDLNELETQDIEVVSYRPKQSLFHWPIGVLIVFQLLIQLGLSVGAWRQSRKTFNQPKALP